jgi:hypothetical protein
VTLRIAGLSDLAALIASTGIGLWSTTAAYPDSATGIVIGRLPLRPAKAIGLTPYRVTGAQPDSLAGIDGVQVRFRARALGDLLDMQDAVSEVLDYRGPTVLGALRYAQIWCQISTPPGSLGSDDLPELADTYYLRTDR